MRKVWLVIPLVIVVFFLIAASQDQEEQEIKEEEKMPPITMELPDSRTFYLGIGPWRYDFNQEAFVETIQLSNQHSDLVMHHFDWGVPWTEALEQKPFHENVELEIQTRIDNKKPGQKVYLAISPQDSDRAKLADYWGKEWYMEIPEFWNDKYFDDPEVISAYLYYARYMIDRFNPDYFAYGIEVNSGFQKDDPKYDRYLVFAQQVYTTLKNENPNLPIFVSISTIAEDDDVELLKELATKVLPYSDFVAISTYPYWKFTDIPKQANPSDIPKDWFSQWAELDSSKPFAVAETAYPAEDLVMSNLGIKFVDMKGTEEWQAQYVQLLLEQANALDAEFIAWFVPRDYDKGWDALVEYGIADEFVKLWKDTGFFDGDGNPRKSSQIWDGWLALPKN